MVKKNNDIIEIPFVAARAEEAHDATSDSFKRITLERVNQPKYRKAAKQFVKDFEIARNNANKKQMETYTENIECEVCGKKETIQLKEDSRFYCSLPVGWMFTDSYPPGDLGTLFVCSGECVEQYYINKEINKYE